MDITELELQVISAAAVRGRRVEPEKSLLGLCVDGNGRPLIEAARAPPAADGGE